MTDRQNIGVLAMGGKVIASLDGTMVPVGHQWLEELCRSHPERFGRGRRWRRVDQDSFLRTATGGLTTDDQQEQEHRESETRHCSRG
jgi:hypothetical protein